MPIDYPDPPGPGPEVKQSITLVKLEKLILPASDNLVKGSWLAWVLCRQNCKLLQMEKNLVPGLDQLSKSDTKC